MRGRRAWPIAALILLVAAMLGWLHLRSSDRLAQGELRAESGRKSTLEAEVLRLQASLAEMDLEKEQLTAAMAAARKTLASDQPDPATRARQRRNILAWLALRNSALYRRLGLTRDQIAQWEDLASSHWMRMAGIEEKRQNHEISGAVAGQLRKQEDSQFQQGETDLLGAAASQQVQDYERSLPARAVINGVAGNLYYTSTPLTAEQGEQLTQILASSSAAYQKGQAARISEVDPAAVLAQAAQFLVPRQLESLRNSLQSTEAFNRVWPLLSSLATPAASPVGTK